MVQIFVSTNNNKSYLFSLQHLFIFFIFSFSFKTKKKQVSLGGNRSQSFRAGVEAKPKL